MKRPYPVRQFLHTWRTLSWLGALAALLTAPAAHEVGAQERRPVRVEGVEEGAIYFEPVAPVVVVPDDFTLEAKELNGKPYDGSEIAQQGLHTLRVTASDGEGRAVCSTTRFFVLDPEERGPEYTVEIVRYHVERLAEHPNVAPTASADERLVLGRSRGWPEDPEIPAHDLYGFQITDPGPEGPKLQVVLVSGNHPREHTGNWALHGALDFLLTDDPRAEDLRRWAVFFAYPMVNPDGRYALSGRSNPEMQAEKVSDHNRVWNTSGRFSTIDAFAEAIRTDTGGTADYLFDFHSAGSTFFFADAGMMGSPYAHAMTAREPDVRPRRSDGQPGMIRIWAMSEEGLNTPFAYTPELAGSESAKRSMAIGRSYMLVFHDLITGSAALAAAAEILEQDRDPVFGEAYRRRIPGLKEKLEDVLAGGDAPVDRTLDAVYELYWGINDYRASVDLTAEAEERTASAQRLLEQPGLTFGIWLQEALSERMGELAAALADPAAENDAVRTQTAKLAGAMDDFRHAEAAEAVVSLASEALGEAHEGFGRLYQDAVARRRECLVERLGTPGTKLEPIRQASEALDRSLASFWRIRGESPFPPVRPVQLAGVPKVLELGTRSDWEDGFLVNVEAEDGGLALADRPALRFGGDGDYVETGFHPGESNLGQRFTWEFWKKYRRFANNTGSSGAAGTTPRFYTQLTDSDGGLRTAIGDSYWTSATLEEEGRWYHIAIVFDEGEVRTYVDGELRDTRAGVKFSSESPSPLAIGKGYGERWLDGYSREHRIWNTARSQSEIRRDRHRRLDGSEEGLIGYWRLDEGEGDTAADRTAAGNHGTVAGARRRRRAVPGYRISQPIALADDLAVGEVVLNWETAEEADDDAGVALLAGLSDDETVLPERWHEATNGWPLALVEEGAAWAGSCLWVKQRLSPRESDAPVVLRRLSVQVR